MYSDGGDLFGPHGLLLSCRGTYLYSASRFYVQRHIIVCGAIIHRAQNIYLGLKNRNKKIKRTFVNQGTLLYDIIIEIQKRF